MKQDEAIRVIEAEYRRSMATFPNFNSAHEGYAVLLEEMDELWEAVKARKPWMHGDDIQFLTSEMVEEAVQIGAMAVKFLVSIETWEQEGALP